MTNEQYTKLRRICGGLAAFMIGGVSIFFSQGGFNISVPEMAWVGWMLALSLPFIELVWNHERQRSFMLYIAGVAAYVYGVVTNTIGLMNLQGYSTLPWDKPWLFIVPAVIGVFLEVIPEPILNVVLVPQGEIEQVFRRGSRRIQPAQTIPVVPAADKPVVATEPNRPVANQRAPVHFQQPR